MRRGTGRRRRRGRRLRERSPGRIPCRVTGIEKIVKNIHIRGYSTSRDDAEALQIREECFTRLKQVLEKARKKREKRVSKKKWKNLERKEQRVCQIKKKQRMKE
jgi:hypothetical protein